MEDDYDVVVDTLQRQIDILMKMTEGNIRMDMFNIMDQIRLEHISTLERAIKLWKENKK